MGREPINLRKNPNISLGKVIRCNTYAANNFSKTGIMSGPWMITDIFPHYIKVRHTKEDIETTINTGDLVMGGVICGG